MSTIELKKLLVKRIQSTDDVEFLKALRVLTEEKLQPISAEVRKKLQRSLEDVKAGRVEDADDVFDELDKWLAKK